MKLQNKYVNTKAVCHAPISGHFDLPAQLKVFISLDIFDNTVKAINRKIFPYFRYLDEMKCIIVHARSVLHAKIISL